MKEIYLRYWLRWFCVEEHSRSLVCITIGSFGAKDSAEADLNGKCMSNVSMIGDRSSAPEFV